jgi:hypothetical protein
MANTAMMVHRKQRMAMAAIDTLDSQTSDVKFGLSLAATFLHIVRSIDFGHPKR